MARRFLDEFTKSDKALRSSSLASSYFGTKLEAFLACDDVDNESLEYSRFWIIIDDAFKVEDGKTILEENIFLL